MAKHRSGFVVAAAFIGPGTVATASMAGANFGFHLAWALLFSVVATIVLQDMTVRLGLATRTGLGQAIRQLLPSRLASSAMALLIIVAIGVGNAAYESGNLTGAAVGLHSVIPLSYGTWAAVMGICAAVLLWFGKDKLIETVLIGLVAVMALVFVTTFLVSSPDWGALLQQVLAPRFDAQTITTTLALIGTTIVPYNLFLHASLVAAQQDDTPTQTRRQSAIAISVGGVITLVIMATATLAFFQHEATLDAGNIAAQLQPLLGDWAESFFALGIFAAGLTSSITAPLAASYAVCGALNRNESRNSFLFRGVWMSIIILGVTLSILGIKPLFAILLAQATNGILLPIIAVFLLIVMNTHPKLGALRNRWYSNILGLGVIVLILLLTTKKLAGI